MAASADNSSAEGARGSGPAKVPWTMRHLVNPVMVTAVRAGLGRRTYAVLETVGRRTGRTRRTPVGVRVEDGVAWLVSEHGGGSAYVRNLAAEPSVRLLTRGGWHAGRATVDPDDDADARRRWIDAAHGIAGRMDARAFAAHATDPTSIRIVLDGG